MRVGFIGGWKISIGQGDVFIEGKFRGANSLAITGVLYKKGYQSEIKE